MGKNLHCIDSAISRSTTEVALKCSDYFVLVRYLVPISTHQVENIFKLTYISIQLVRVRFWPPRLSMGCQFIYYSEALTRYYSRSFSAKVSMRLSTVAECDLILLLSCSEQLFRNKIISNSKNIYIFSCILCLFFWLLGFSDRGQH